MRKKRMISPRVLLIEDYNRDFMRIEHVLDVLQDMNIIHFHTEHQNSLNFQVAATDEDPALRIMYMNKNYLAAIFFGENALMLQSTFLTQSDVLQSLDAEVNKAGGEGPVELLVLLSEILDEQPYQAVLHN